MSDDLSPFQKVCLAITGGCGCVCHAGIGMRAVCEHCYDPKQATASNSADLAE